MSFLNFSLPIINKIYNIANLILIFGAVLVAIGTIAAIWSAGVRERYADERISTNEAETARAKESASLANQRTAEANLEIEKLKSQMAWRRLTVEQHKIIIDNLKGHNMEVWTSFVGSDPEAILFRDDIDRALKEAGIKTKYFGGYTVAVGVHIVNTGTSDYALLAKSFTAAKIPFISVPEERNGPKGLMVLVGSKLPID